MAIKIKTSAEINKIRIAGRLAAEVLEMIKIHIMPNISTATLDRICHEYIIKKQNAFPACLNYHGFPKSICISVNDVVCHGIPNEEEILQENDIVNIDVTVLKNQYHGDTSAMFIVGQSTIHNQRLCKITQESLYLAINMVKPGVRLRTIGREIQNFIEKHHYSVVREYCGHGIGKRFHEEPYILHYDAEDGGVILKQGMVFTIEPMINAGDSQIYRMPDGWTVKTKDHSLSAQYEHTIVVTHNGCEVVTLRKDDTIPRILIHKN
ncbi:type I methionyl aminopeptidase [Candidatus Erwinia haradaeae]|uniref:Methionine aminopeptidase n=1 Tax=Candidatus Erwinia haradaeae TaxID=1922217 RepID=A0A451D1Z7_9GAMM|nr:type I methionyl aminopeptidase [Candidatus Erwinia haradaeae]VFP79634.1 Methionine aminopeptidase [Candidatus Erwinia haradaeae]